MARRKLAYVPMVADYLHVGHLNILKTAAELGGDVMVGLFTNKAVASYKRLPFMSFEQRKMIVENIKGVTSVVAQDEKNYEPNLRKYRPDFLVHGTDWREGPLKKSRERAIAVMAEWGGEVIEPEYTAGISSTEMHRNAKKIGIMPHRRLSALRRLLEVKSPVRIMEAHNALSAIVAESAEYAAPGEGICSFDGLWLSSLTDSTAKGKPDIEFVDLTSRIVTVNDILECTTKPILYDGDTGSTSEHFAFTVRRLERLGVSGVIIEDKTGRKRNSLLESTEKIHVQEDVGVFCDKIQAGKLAQMSDDFMIIARIESFILGAGIDDAIRRAEAYIQAGADGIMIHSRRSDGKEIFNFCELYNKFAERRPLVAVPTNYPVVFEKDLRDAGVDMVIYANQLLRAAYTSMTTAAESILRHGRAYEADQDYIAALALIRIIEGN